ncbi:sensor histidine kinase [Nocardiopsis sp. MG754419]|uniref:sensor histidine kinase n=1 Tax=Nocardiopsis sp. MG754419 TaxID=2259865 RepID=UPI001BA76CFE|nr:histidine kinase [Nocardiopsis sp. MG754419]MBR8745044.1 histidine kinase [Nocardiopsis sp. MG754419]
MSVLSPRSVHTRASSWAREHVFVMDATWAALWFALAAATWPLSSSSTLASIAYLILALGCCAALSVRRVRPVTSLVVLALLLLLQVGWMGQFTTLSVICALVAAYTSHAELSVWWRRTALAALLLGSTGAVLLVPDVVYGTDLLTRVASLVSSWTTLSLFALLGTVRRRDREEVDRLREHARLSEARREQELRLAALDERTHIAREMHDVLAHSLNVIVAQADGGRYAASTSPERAVEALETIGRVGRASAGELHRLLGVLREDGPREVAPAPGLDGLPSLVEGYREAGLRARLVWSGGPSGNGTAAPPASVAATVYRLVQEALANALKHAGPVDARVELAHTTGRIVVTVTNPLPAAPGTTREGGHGLVGMRERVALHGGSLRVGPDEETGLWRVGATVPWEEDA